MINAFIHSESKSEDNSVSILPRRNKEWCIEITELYFDQMVKIDGNIWHDNNNSVMGYCLRLGCLSCYDEL